MNPLRHVVRALSRRARAHRAEIFRRNFALGPRTRILDLGSENGSFIHSVLQGTPVEPSNVYIADIQGPAIAEGAARFGFNPVLVDESGPLPFDDGFFDVVHCSSVIEHVTVSKDEVWSLRSGDVFRRQASVHQHEIAREIARLGRQYFVQTPCRSFPVESHTWLPGLGWLPRPVLIPTLRLTNRLWIKKTSPDWRLLNGNEMAELFPDARIVAERALGMTKSIMAVKAEGAATQ